MIDERYLAALDGLTTGDQVVVLTWLDRADRDTLVVLDLKPVLTATR